MKVFRTLTQRSARVGAIVALSGAIFGAGHFLTPRAPEAAASVFQDLGSALQDPAMPEYMRLQVDEGAVQQVYLNDNTLFYAQYHSDKDIKSLLDYYENLYQGPGRDIVPEAAKRALLATVKDPKGRADNERRIDATEKLLNQHHIRFEGRDWGGFGTILTGKETDPGYTKDLIDRFRTFKQTGLVKDLGDPKLVVAFKDHAEGGSQYFTVWPGEDFDQRKVRPRNGEDSPGYDIEDVERPYGSRRMVTFAQDHGGVGYTVLVYRGDGSRDETEQHYAESMSAAGWAISTRYEESRQRMEEPSPSMLFVKDQREAFISLSPFDDGQNRGTTSTVVIYDRS